MKVECILLLDSFQYFKYLPEVNGGNSLAELPISVNVGGAEFGVASRYACAKKIIYHKKLDTLHEQM